MNLQIKKDNKVIFVFVYYNNSDNNIIDKDGR